jgi:hypothetical protein
MIQMAEQGDRIVQEQCADQQRFGQTVRLNGLSASITFPIGLHLLFTSRVDLDFRE